MLFHAVCIHYVHTAFEANIVIPVTVIPVTSTVQAYVK
jgi:hypothetical protein